MGPEREAHRYRWPDGKTSCVVFSADVDAESPLLWANRGQSVERLGEVEMRRFGPRVGLGRVLALLDEFGAKGSFYVPGVVARSHPEILPRLVEAGHEIGVHGDYHERVDQLSDDENREILGRCLALFESQTGIVPRGYRSPAWEITPGLHRLLREHSFGYDSSLMGYDHPYTLGGLTEVPVQWFTDDAVYFRYFGGGRDRWPPASPKVVLESWVEELEGIREVGGLLMITVHPWISGRAQRIRLLRELLRRVTRHPEVWLATAEEVARHHVRSENADRFNEPLRMVDTGF